jgi:hypothetical protein
MDLETASPPYTVDTEVPARTGVAAREKHAEELDTGFEIAEDIRQVLYKCSSSGLPAGAKPHPGKIVEKLHTHQSLTSTTCKTASTMATSAAYSSSLYCERGSALRPFYRMAAGLAASVHKHQLTSASAAATVPAQHSALADSNSNTAGSSSSGSTANKRATVHSSSTSSKRQRRATTTGRRAAAADTEIIVSASSNKRARSSSVPDSRRDSDSSSSSSSGSSAASGTCHLWSVNHCSQNSGDSQYSSINSSSTSSISSCKQGSAC